MAKFNPKDQTFEAMFKEVEKWNEIVTKEAGDDERWSKVVSISKMAHKAAEIVKNGLDDAKKNNEKISHEQIRFWKKAFAGISGELDMFEGVFQGLLENIEKSHGEFSKLLNLMNDRLDEYLKNKDEEWMCDVNTVEAEKQALTDAYNIEHAEEIAELEKKKAEAAKAAEAAKLKREQEAKAAEAAKQKREQEAKAAEAELLENASKTKINVRNTLSKDVKKHQEKLADTNASLFTKQSNQFRKFRNIIGRLEQALDGGEINGDNLERIAKLVIAAEYGRQEYDAHCQRHAKSNNKVRDRRIQEADKAMETVKQLEAIPVVKAKMNELINSKTFVKKDNYEDIASEKNIYMLEALFKK